MKSFYANETEGIFRPVGWLHRIKLLWQNKPSGHVVDMNRMLFIIFDEIEHGYIGGNFHLYKNLKTGDIVAKRYTGKRYLEKRNRSDSYIIPLTYDQLMGAVDSGLYSSYTFSLLERHLKEATR